jgi:hypothetical protein
MKRVWITTLVCLAALLLSLPPIYAGAERVSMEAEVGFNGTYLMGAWTPIRVRIENTGSDLEGSLEAVVKAGQRASIVYSTPVSLPNTSVKEYTIYARISELERYLDIHLKDKRGKILQTQRVTPLSPIEELYKNLPLEIRQLSAGSHNRRSAFAGLLEGKTGSQPAAVQL